MVGSVGASRHGLVSVWFSVSKVTATCRDRELKMRMVSQSHPHLLCDDPPVEALFAMTVEQSSEKF